MNDHHEWFAPKTYGYGAGLPVSWQGWLVFIFFLLVLILAAVVIAPRSELAFFATTIPLTVAFIMIARKTTRGGWRWRWGDED